MHTNSRRRSYQRKSRLTDPGARALRKWLANYNSHHTRHANTHIYASIRIKNLDGAYFILADDKTISRVSNAAGKVSHAAAAAAEAATARARVKASPCKRRYSLPIVQLYLHVRQSRAEQSRAQPESPLLCTCATSYLCRRSRSHCARNRVRCGIFFSSFFFFFSHSPLFSFLAWRASAFFRFFSPEDDAWPVYSAANLYSCLCWCSLEPDSSSEGYWNFFGEP